MKMRNVLIGIASTVLVVIASVPLAAMAWLRFYTADLPDVRKLEVFTPSVPTVVTIEDGQYASTSTALPLALLGTTVENAFIAAEGDVDPRGWIHRYYCEFRDDQCGHRYGTYSWQIARHLPHNARIGLKWQLWWLRTSIQVERRFNRDQMLTVYMNETYLGDEIYGVENAALYYFGKHARDLSVEEAASIAGLARSPAMYSPQKHPDATLKRRNQVIDIMAASRLLSREEAERSKATPLRIALH